MISNHFPEFVKKCFEGDLRSRELRLSEEERDFIKAQYPQVRFKAIDGVENQDDKLWYQVFIA